MKLNEEVKSYQALQKEKIKLESDKTDLQVQMSKSPDKSAKSENTASPGRDEGSLQDEIRKRDIKIERLKKLH